MKEILKGKWVRLSAVDQEEMGRALSNGNRDTELMRLMDAGPARLHSVKATSDVLEKMVGGDSCANHYFCIRALADDRLLGDINLNVNQNAVAREAFIGIGIFDRKDWNRGYGTDAMQVLLRFAFIEVNLYRVSLFVFEYNQRAIRSYEKLGFVHEGRSRGALLRGGRRWDLLYMGLLHEEWMKVENGGIQNT